MNENSYSLINSININIFLQATGFELKPLGNHFETYYPHILKNVMPLTLSLN
jgi:hypothetical protein